MRVIIAEDAGLFGQMLAQLLTSYGHEVIGVVATEAELLDLAEPFPPDVVLLDIRLPPTYTDEGIRAAHELRARCPEMGILVLSHYAETSYAVSLLEAGAAGMGYLVKDRVGDGDLLVAAMRRVAARETVIDPEVVERLTRRRRVHDPLSALSPAERQTLALMAEGLSNAAIASRAGYSVKTVEKHVTAITQKLCFPPPDADDRKDINVRVAAVLTYLRSHAQDGQAPVEQGHPG